MGAMQPNCVDEILVYMLIVMLRVGMQCVIVLIKALGVGDVSIFHLYNQQTTHTFLPHLLGAMYFNHEWILDFGDT